MCNFNYNPFSHRRRRWGFTIVEIAAALMILSVIISSVMVLMNRFTGVVIDLRLREQAFDIARSNMEALLTESKSMELNDYGTSDTHPDIEWQTVVEPFYEPVTNRMWVRAVCSAGFYDSQGERQDVELEHWLSNLTVAQVRQIVAQQEIELEYLELLEGGEESAIQETTRAYLEEEGLDVEAYDQMVEQQRRQKLEYIAENGMEGYDEFVAELKEEENIILEELGLDFDKYNVFAATYVPESTFSDEAYPTDTDPATEDSTDSPDTVNNDDIPWDIIPREWWPLFEQFGYTPPY